MISGGLNGAWLAVGILSFGFQFLALAAFLSFLGPIGLLVAAIATIVLGILYVNSVIDTMKLLDSGQISPEVAQGAIAAKSLAVIVNNVFAFFMPLWLEGEQAIVGTVYRVVLMILTNTFVRTI